MPNEPEREIERQLKAGAQLRRDAAGAPRAMPPATRQKLQAEAARLHSRKEARPGFWSQIFIFSWPRLAIATATIVLLGLLVSHFLPGSPQTLGGSRLALNEFKPTAQFGFDTTAEKTAKPAVASPAPETPAPTKPEVATDEFKTKAPMLNSPTANPTVATLAKDDVDKIEVSRSRALSNASRDAQKAESTLRRGGSAANNQIPTFASAAPAVPSEDRKPGATRVEIGAGPTTTPAGGLIHTSALITASVRL